MKLELESDRLLIRSLNSDYATSVAAFYQRNLDDLKHWEPNINEHFLSPDFHKKVFDYETEKRRTSGSIRYWLSFKDSPTVLIGSVNFQNILYGAFRSCQIGYKMDIEFRGFGFMHEALSTTIECLRTEERIHRFEAIIEVSNQSSIHLVERMGFLREGISKDYVFLNGDWRDCYRYALLFKN